jgi:hypothetical protein
MYNFFFITHQREQLASEIACLCTAESLLADWDNRMSTSSRDDVIVELRRNLDYHLRIIGCREASDAVRRNAASKLMDSIAEFFGKWERAFSSDPDKYFPGGVLREAFSSLLAELGPGDGQLRAFLLQHLSNVTTSSCRQILLDILPSAMPVVHNSHATGNSGSTELDRVTNEVIEIFRRVLTKDPAALLPVIGCLSVMPLSDVGRRESFQVTLTSLEIVPEHELPILVTTLLRHVDSEEEAILALQSLRTELSIVECSDNMKKEGDPISMVIHVVLNALFDDENDNLIAKAYSKILKQLADWRQSSDSIQTNHKANNFLLIDITIMISILQHPDFIEHTEELLIDLLKDNEFPFETLEKIIILICSEKNYGRPTSVLHRRLMPSLLSFGIFLLLSPARIGAISNKDPCNLRIRQNLQQVMVQTCEFIINVHHHADRETQSELIHGLLHLSEESANSKWETARNKSPRKVRLRQSGNWFVASKRATGGDEGQYEWFQVVIDDTVNNTLQILAKKSKENFVSFKQVLIGRLTNNISFRSTEWESRCMKHLCAILSALFEPIVSSLGGGSGIQASELLILVQKLLFSPSFSAGKSSYSVDNRRVVRGLLLATELVRSPVLGRSDWDCIKEWVLRILLPTTRRMVDPEIGSPGLLFLEALMTSPSNHQDVPFETRRKDNFQHMKMILANTGLIQILAHYRQQQQQSRERDLTPVLGYTTEPSNLFTTEAGVKRKKRDMVFCLAFFLRNSDLHQPCRWRQTINWVFHLVDTYLRIGRNISLANSNETSTGKRFSANLTWMPHGWLQAAIEYPAFVPPRDVEATNKRQQCALEWARVEFSSYDVTSLENEAVVAQDIQCSLAEMFSKLDSKELEDMVKRATRLALASLLGISLSFAVVKNSYEHLQSIASSKSDERLEILRLIQFQMIKILSMKRKCVSVETLLGAQLSSVSRILRSMKRNARDEDIQEETANEADLEGLDEDNSNQQGKSDSARANSESASLERVRALRPIC